MLDHLSGFGHWRSLFSLVSNNHVIVGELVLAVGVDVGVEDCEAVDVADRVGYLAQSLNLLLVGDALLEDGLAFALEPAEHEEDELLEVPDLELGLLAQLPDLVLHHILGIHI